MGRVTSSDGQPQPSDEVGLETIVPWQQWRAFFPIPSACTAVNGRLEGLVYVCEEVIDHPRTLGARYHAGIRYDLAIEDGRLAEGSELWMGSLFRSPKLDQNQVPLNQWLGYEPLPTIPAGKRTVAGWVPEKEGQVEPK